LTGIFLSEFAKVNLAKVSLINQFQSVAGKMWTLWTTGFKEPWQQATELESKFQKRFPVAGISVFIHQVNADYSVAVTPSFLAGCIIAHYMITCCLSVCACLLWTDCY